MMSGILNWQTCKRCFKSYDIGTNLDICPECRMKEKKKILEDIDNQRIKEEKE